MKARRSSVALAFLLAASHLVGADLPTCGSVSAGAATISTQGAAMTVHQSTAKAVINWQGFSVGAGHSVQFQQPDASAVVLNRVTGSEASVISGALSANGNVFLVNPNGVLFNAGAQVDVGGLVASTLSIRDNDFLAGN